MKKALTAIAISGCLMLSACGLLPEEEVFRSAPLISDYQKEEFKLAECTRGDMVLTTNISPVYVPVRTEVLSFGVGGIRYDEFYVQAGDSVHEGDLLAQLRLDGIDDSVEAAARQIENLKVQMQHLEQDRELAVKRERVARMGQSDAQLNEALESVRRRYDTQAQALKDSLEIAQLQYECRKDDLAQRQIFAPIDGTVTYVRKVSAGDVSTLSERVVTVADSTMSLFRAETVYWDRFEPGQTVTITANRVEYEAVVMSEEQLGLKETEHLENTKAYVYFALSEPTFELEDNDRGTMTLVLDTRENVLRVPKNAISTINGDTVVYYQDDEDMKAYKVVETGLEAGNMIEIISGLEEGEIVIAG